MGSGGLAGCSDPNAPDPSWLQAQTVGQYTTAGTCKMQPATDYENCASVLGTSEWGNDTSVNNGAGAYLGCTKVNYSGSPANCCAGIQPVAPNSCDPNLTVGSQGCDSYNAGYCTGGNTFSTQCSGYNNRNAAAFNQNAANYCFSGNNMQTNTTCRSWISQNNGKYDGQMQSYCNENPTDTLCNCIKSPTSQIIGAPFCPEDYDQKCVAGGGYKTQTMLTQNCPAFQYCQQNVVVPPGAMSVLVGNNIQQNCSAGTTSTSNTNSGVNATQGGANQGGSKTNTTGSSTPSSSDIIWYILIFVALVVVIGLVYVAAGGLDEAPAIAIKPPATTVQT